MNDGFVYLVAVMDWFSRYVLSRSPSVTMEVDFCVEALKRALRRGLPEIRMRCTVALAARLKEGCPASIGCWARATPRGLANLPATMRPPRRGCSLRSSDRPPKGYSQWNGNRLAEALPDVGKHRVWRIPRRHDIRLQRRRCGRVVPQPAPECAGAIGGREALDSGSGTGPGLFAVAGRKPVYGFSHGYKRHGTTTPFAALALTNSSYSRFKMCRVAGPLSHSCARSTSANPQCPPPCT